MQQKEVAAALAAAMLLAGCGGTQMRTMPEETPASGASPAAEPREDAASDSAAETGEAAAPEQHTISLEQWRAQMSGQAADYTIEGPHAATSRLEDLAMLPEDSVTLQVMWWGGNGTLAESYANSARYDEKMNIYAGGYMQGENDELWFTGGERGTNILYCGTTFTEPELQSDGSLTFWQLSLQADCDSFEGWTQPVKVAQAEVTPVRLVPTENGWRVDKLELPL